MVKRNFYFCWNSLSALIVTAIHFSVSILLRTNEMKSLKTNFVAELQRAKRASQAPWLRKIGNPSSRENLAMTSAYERPSVRPNRLGGRGRGVSRLPMRETKECHLFLAVFCLEKSEKHSFLFAMSTNDRRGSDLTIQGRVQLKQNYPVPGSLTVQRRARERGLVGKKERSRLPFSPGSRLSPVRLFDRPHWPRAWNRLKQNVKENGREQGLTDKDVARKFAREQATATKKAR